MTGTNATGYERNWRQRLKDQQLTRWLKDYQPTATYRCVTCACETKAHVRRCVTCTRNARKRLSTDAKTLGIQG